MAWFEGTHSETLTFNGDLDAIRSHFANPETILGATKGLESSSVDDGTIHFVLEEEDHGVVKFKADYRCNYVLDGNTLSWTPVGEGNLKQTGKVTFAEADGAVKVDYTETVEVDLGVPGMMAPMLKPVIGPMLAGEIKEFVKRLTADL